MDSGELTLPRSFKVQENGGVKNFEHCVWDKEFGLRYGELGSFGTAIFTGFHFY